MPDIRRILKYLPEKRRTLLFSATAPPKIRRLTGDIVQCPATVQVRITAPADAVSHARYPAAQLLKTALLLEQLGNTHNKSKRVFRRTRHRTQSLQEKPVAAGYRSASLK